MSQGIQTMTFRVIERIAFEAVGGDPIHMTVTINSRSGSVVHGSCLGAEWCRSSTRLDLNGTT